MRFTTITGKAKQYVEDNFPGDLYSICSLVNLQPQCIRINDETKLYGTFGNRLYHFPTIREELKAYLQSNTDDIQVNFILGEKSWDDVFNAKTTKELINPPTVKIETKTI
jgi:hypothetical protein